MSKDVFISYKSDEFDIANNIYKKLKTNGVSVWMAPQDIPGGSSYAMEITNAIKGCKIFVLILSKAAQTSQWIPKEIDNAINEKKLILPFMVEKCQLNAEFSFLLSNIQFKDGYTDPEKAITLLIGEIKRHLGIRETSPAASQPPKKKPGTSDIPPDKIIEFVGKQLNGEKPDINPSPTPAPAQKQKTPKPEAYSPYENGFTPPVSAPEQKSAPVYTAPTPSAAASAYSVRNTAGKKKSGKKKAIIAAIIIFVLLVVPVLAVILSSISFVPPTTIAGTEYSSTTSFLIINDKELTDDDMNSLINFGNLSSISFTNCTITASSFCPFILPELTSITIKNCNMTQEFYDSINISEYTNLYKLDISGNPLITDLGINEGEAQKLTHISVAGTSVENIDTVYNTCTKITTLDISDTPIRDVSFLVGNQKLISLGIARLELTSLECLQEMIFLEEINASGNNIGNPDDLSNCTLLRKVDLSDCGISDISVLSKSSESLTELYLENNSISDLSPLEGCVNLTILDITSNNASSLAAIKSCVGLKTLLASDNGLTSVEGIEALTMLNELDLSDNRLTKISTALVFDGYAIVYLNDNELTEIDLVADNRYYVLELHNNSLTSSRYLNEISASSISFDYTEDIDTDVIDSNFISATIYNCPLDKQAEILNNTYCVSFAD